MPFWPQLIIYHIKESRAGPDFTVSGFLLAGLGLFCVVGGPVEIWGSGICAFFSGGPEA